MNLYNNVECKIVLAGCVRDGKPPLDPDQDNARVRQEGLHILRAAVLLDSHTHLGRFQVCRTFEVLAAAASQRYRIQ